MNSDKKGHEVAASKKVYHAPELIALGPIQTVVTACPGCACADGGGAPMMTSSAS